MLTAFAEPASTSHPSAGEGGVPDSTVSFTRVESVEGEHRDTDTATGHAAGAIGNLPGHCALLVVRRGVSATSRFLLDSDLTTAGRHPETDIFLDDVTVSRWHAEFYRGPDGFSVRDLGSLNGTYVNRERIETSSLAAGDEVQIGKFRLGFLLGPRTGEGTEARGVR